MSTNKPRKALLLLSGGLDSRLAVRLMQEQGIKLEAVNFKTIFCTCTARGKSCSEAVSAAKEANIPLKVFNTTKEIMDVVEHPRFGYGSSVNPCIDCRIAMFKKAKEYMRTSEANFIITGEVLGERPMSQRKDAIEKIEKESGLEGLILRPLSAKLFEPTMPEKEGWVDRSKLLDITGRSRKPQIELAKQLGINDYPCPAGGCLLTDKDFGKRVKDLISHNEWKKENALLLKYGRHFRLSKKCKAIIGRDKKENSAIEALRKENDLLLKVQDLPGPTSLVKGNPSDGDMELALGLTAYFVTKRAEGDKIKIETGRTSLTSSREVLPASKEQVSKYRIGL